MTAEASSPADGPALGGTVFLTVLIPAYNEETNLAHTVNVLRGKLAELGVTFEILIADDASRDRTGPIADALAAEDPRVRVAHHPANRGIGGGFLTGVQHACGQWMILIPADLALDSNELGKYLAAAQTADVVVGVRSDRSDYTLLRRAVSWVNITAIQVLFGMRQRQFNYISLYRLSVLRQMTIDYWRSAFFFAEVMIKARSLGYRLTEVDIRYVPRVSGKATGANWKLIARTACDMLAFRWKLTTRGV